MRKCISVILLSALMICILMSGMVINIGANRIGFTPVVGAASTNLATGATASASSQWDSNYSASKANDSNISTRWSGAEGDVSGAWLSLDFGTPRTFCQVVFKQETTWARISSYNIQYWDSISFTWQNCYTGGSMADLETDNFTAVTSQKIRLYINSTSTNITPSIKEFEVYPPGDNLAIGATASASSQWDGNYSASNSNDSNAGTRWSGATGDVSGAWLSLDFGTRRTFCLVVFKQETTWTRINSYNIQYWDSVSSTWQNCYTGGAMADIQTDGFTAVTSQKIRLYVNSTSTSITPSIKEFEVYSLGNNLAIGATASASSQWDSNYTADKANDGSMSTRWNTQYGQNTGWLELDFGSPVTFRNCVFYQETAWTRISSYNIQYWDSVSSTWQNCYTGGSMADLETDDFTPVTSQKVRLLVNGTTGNTPTIKEFQVYDSMQASPTQSWNIEAMTHIKADYLYFNGGKDSEDTGCPAWGTARSNEFRMIGNNAGYLTITYEGNIADTVPLIYGYTIWWQNEWNNSGKEPFTSDSTARSLLQSTLFLKNGYEGSYPYVLRIHLRNIPIVKIESFDNPGKDGLWLNPQLRFGNVTQGQASSDSISTSFDISDPGSFFPSHTIESNNAYPSTIQNNITSLINLLYTKASDLASVTSVDIPGGYTGPYITFSGSNEANIISSVFYNNITDMKNRVAANGLVNESASDAPEWWYTGMGAWANNVHAYYGNYYTRNKALPALADLNYTTKCNSALGYLDNALMYFPNNYPALQLLNQIIPGHWTVVAQDPLLYSKVLVGVGWPTQYTQARFGSHYQDFGNPETDGHGLSMIAHWKTWNKLGRSGQWVTDRWAYLQEAANYIGWHLDHPDRSFTSNGVMYSESEAGMMDYTMWCNVPCYIGLLMYADMADAIGQTTIALGWRNRAAALKTSMESYFAASDPVYGNIWRKTGFFNYEANLTFFQKYYGNDLLSVLPSNWIERAKNTYTMNVVTSAPDYFGPAGLGYNHDVLAETAMLTDNMSDTTKWMKNLAFLCYAPRLPRPYIVPEGASVDVANGIVRRQGDLGNGYQQAETINTIILCAGIDDCDPSGLKIMPRLPDNWDLQVRDYPVITGSGSSYYTCNLEMSMTYPRNNVQNITLKSTSAGTIKNVKLRIGPFPLNTPSVQVKIGSGNYTPYTCGNSGDRAWTWVNIGDLALNNLVQVSVIY